MQLLLGVGFALICAAILFGLGLSGTDVKDVLSTASNPSLREQTKKKRKNIFRYFHNIRTMMEAMGKSRQLYTVLSGCMLLAVVGVSLGISFGNLFLAPVFGVALMTAPLVYLQFQYLGYKRLMVEEMETALSVISLSYERTENILLAFKENLPHIRPPMRRICEEFVWTVEHVNPSLESAIDDMKGKIDHFVFREWCDALRRCMRDRTLKHTLRPIVRKLTDIKLITGELSNILFQAKRTFWQMLVLTIALLGVGFFLVPSGFGASIKSPVTDLLFAVDLAAILFTTVRVLLETRDIDFDQ